MRTLVLSIFTVPRPFVLHVNRLQVIWSAVNYKYQSQQPAHFIVWSRPSVGMAKDRAASNHAPSRLNSCCRTLESARVSRDASANVLGGKLTALIPLGNQSSSFIHNSAPTGAWAFQSVHRALCRLLSSFSYYLYILKSIFFSLLLFGYWNCDFSRWSHHLYCSDCYGGAGVRTIYSQRCTVLQVDLFLFAQPYRIC